MYSTTIFSMKNIKSLGDITVTRNGNWGKKENEF